MEQCNEELDYSTNLTLYSSEQAAHDLAYLINNDSPKDKNIVYGVSYGTLWLTRFVENYPNLAEGVIFDSVVSSFGQVLTYLNQWVTLYLTSSWSFCHDHCWFLFSLISPSFNSQKDYNHDRVIKNYLDLCAADSFCSSRLTDNPLQFSLNTLASVYSEDSCPGSSRFFPLSRDLQNENKKKQTKKNLNFWAEVKEFFPTRISFVRMLFTLIESNLLRPYVTAALYRLSKCEFASPFFRKGGE